MIAKTKHFKRGGYRRNAFFYLISAAAILTVIVFLTYTDLRVSRKKGELYSQLTALEKEIKNLEEKNAQLKAQISKEQTEGFLETEARERLGFKKPGEEVVVVLPPKGVENNTATASAWQNLQAEISDFFKKIFGR